MHDAYRHHLLPTLSLMQLPCCPDNLKRLPKLVCSAALIFSAASVSQLVNAKQSITEEVIVTAQKRAQSTQDVSLAVTAFDGDAIERMGFEEGLDITLQVPNMTYFAIFGEASSPSVSLRGLSLVNFSDSWESPVSIYVDDVYRGNPAGSAIQLFDLERVEVLRGPQGTLYGRNTTGGLVHYVSKKPTDTPEASLSLSYGSYSERIMQGVFSGPINDRVRVRQAMKLTRRDGWQTNVASGEKLNNTDSFGYRTQAEIDLSDSTQLLINVHGSRADQQSVGFAHMGYLQEPEEGAQKCSIQRIHSGLCTSATFEKTGAEAVNGQYNPEHVASGAAEGLRTEIETFGLIANLTSEFDDITLTSVTAYEELDKFLQDDGDGLTDVWFDEQYGSNAEQFTQELRLNGGGPRSKWVGGVYYYLDDRDLSTQAPTTAHAIIYGGYFHEEYVALETESWAIFGQYEYDLARTVTAVAGIRYTEEERDFWQRSPESFYDEPVNATDSLSEDAVTGRLGLDWRPNPGTLIYTSYSTGFKSGGFSGSYNASLEATRPVTSEDISNFEVGLKTAFSEGRIRLNAAAFTYTVEDYQAQVFLTVDQGSVITNAGDVTGTGAEAELIAAVSDNFEVIAGLGLLDSEFDSTQQFEVAQEFYYLDGNELPSAPGMTYNLVGRYYLPLAERGEAVFQLDYAWQDDHYLQIENDPYSYQDGYGIANAQISWTSPSGITSAALFVKNVFDEEYFTYQNTLGPDWGYGVWGKPRSVGLEVAWQL